MTDSKRNLAILAGGAVLAGVAVWLYRKGRPLSDAVVGKVPVPNSMRSSVTSKNGMTLKHYRQRGMPIEQRIALLQDLVWKGVQDPEMRKLALKITSQCPERDGTCEARAIYAWTRANVRYTGDIADVKHGSRGPKEPVDLFQSAARTVEFGGGDCLPMTTLVLRDDFQLVPLLALEPGVRIMADGDWTEVQELWATGEKELLSFQLSNGSVLRCTPEHRIFRQIGTRTEEIRASEARVGDDLVTPTTIPCAEDSDYDWPAIANKLSDEELGWLLGVFIADGWTDGKNKEEPSRAAFSGKDGHPKEEQKRRIATMMERIGVPTRWHQRYLAVNDKTLATFFRSVGTPAYNKHVPSLGFASRAQVVSVLEGLSADADQRGVFGTTSPALAMQLRILHRMLGVSTHMTRVDNHGGLGTHPVYRVTPRYESTRLDHCFARIRSISDGGTPEPCMDLTTSAGKLWLPESDTIVHNCDDQATLNAVLLSLNGIQARLRVTSPRNSSEWGHIYTLAGLPKLRPSEWIALDTTLPGPDKFALNGSGGSGEFGREVPYGRRLDFVA